MLQFLSDIGKSLLAKIETLDSLASIAILFGMLFLVGGISIAYFFWKQLKDYMITMAAERKEYNAERTKYSETMVTLVKDVVISIKDNAASNVAIANNVAINNELTKSLKTTNDELIKTLLQRRL